MGRVIKMETDIYVLKLRYSSLRLTIKNIEKELEGLSKLQSIVDDASKLKPKTKPKSKTSKKGGNQL